MIRQQLPNRRASENFDFEVAGLRFTATVSRFPDSRVGELFLNNHKAGNQSDTNARDAAIVLSFALQYGADLETIRRALCRDSKGRALGPLSAALHQLNENSGPTPATTAPAEEQSQSRAVTIAGWIKTGKVEPDHLRLYCWALCLNLACRRGGIAEPFPNLPLNFGGDD
jgi:hypothetical protein